MISVIVPIYKVEKYLRRCVDSILAQTYGDLEVILVDDGSPDGSGMICDEYAQKDSRVRVVHKKNGGLSDARNAGLEVATGEYIGFIDSDDYIHPQMYEKLLTALEQTGSQISLCGYAYVDEQTGAFDESYLSLNPITTEVLSRMQALEKINSYRSDSFFYVTAWNKLYKRELFANARFMKGKLHEDEFIVHHLINMASSVATIEDILYYYVQRSGSIMNSRVTEKSLDIVEAMLDRYAFYQSIQRKDLAVTQLRATMWSIISRLDRMDSGVDVEYVRRTVKPVKKAMLQKLDLRVIYLLKAWTGYCHRRKKEQKI